MYGPCGLDSGLGGMVAFLLRLPGEGVVGRLMAGEELVILGTGECEGGLVRAGGWISTALAPRG